MSDPASEPPALAGGAVNQRLRRRFVWVAAVVVLVGVALVGYFAFRGPTDDFGRFQGEWAVSVQGRPNPITVRVEGDHWTYRIADRPTRTYRLTLTPDAKAIELTQLGTDGQPARNTHGPGAGTEVRLTGTYTLSGDEATVTLRPATDTDEPQVLTLTRVKK